MAEHLESIKCANAKYDDDLEEIIIKDSENETSLHEKDKLVKSLQNTIVGYEVKLDTLASEQESKGKEYEDRLRTEVSLYESKIQDYDNKLKAKDEEIYSQNEMLRINNTTGNRIRKSNKNEVVRLKAKGRGSARNISNHTCDSPSCDAVNVDLIWCCVCLNYLCEKCSDVQVNKFKLITDKCGSVYFVCKKCDLNDQVIDTACISINVVEHDKEVATPVSESIFEKTILDKLQGIEERIDETIS